MRGGTSSTTVGSRAATGSPPRAWGHPAKFGVVKRAPRFTPTCVGTPINPGLEKEVGKVHPHVRGDTSVTIPRPTIEAGSPPRAWGHLDMGTPSSKEKGFTPTCVGTPRLYGPPAGPPWVHPHVRGDTWSMRTSAPSGCSIVRRSWPGLRPGRGTSRSNRGQGYWPRASSRLSPSRSPSGI